MPQPTQLSTAQLTQLQKSQASNSLLKAHITRIETRLRLLGAVTYNMWLPESHALPFFVHPGEKITGVVYGRYKRNEGREIGRGLFVATDQRVLFVDKKPLYVRSDEITYEVISGVSYSRVTLAGTVILHTRMGDISIRTFNHTCARTFVKAVEVQIFQNKSQGAQ